MNTTSMDVKNVVRLYREGKRSNASTYKNVEDANINQNPIRVYIREKSIA